MGVLWSSSALSSSLWKGFEGISSAASFRKDGICSRSSGSDQIGKDGRAVSFSPLSSSFGSRKLNLGGGASLLSSPKEPKRLRDGAEEDV